MMICDFLSFVLLLTSGLVAGLKSNEKPGKFENDQLKVNTNILKGNHNIFLQSDQRLSNITEDPDNNRSMSFLYDLNVWDPYTMAKFWDFEARKFLNVSANCEKDMTEYLIALLAKEEWSLKSK